MQPSASEREKDQDMELVPYDPQWPRQFEAEAARVRSALGRLACRIDHNGSTAIPGISAKPVIDIQVSVESLQPLTPFRDRLAPLGYVHVPHADDAFCPFFHRPASWPHTHHVHLVKAGSDEERRTLAFRDYLRAHADAAREYERLKLKLAAEFQSDRAAEREAYALAKSGFVERIVALALAAGFPADVERH